MQLHVLTVFALLVTFVAAKGVRNGYERVWLWYAYQIDLELPEADRKIAVRCIQFDYSTKTCPPKYRKMKKGKPVGPELNNFEPCKGTRPGGSCYFFEFMGWIDGKTYKAQNNFLLPTDPNNPNEADQKNLKPDPTTTANWLSVAHQPRPDNNPIRSVRYRPFRAFKGADLIYNDMLKALGQHSITTISGLSAEKKAAHKADTDAIKKSLRGVLIERAIDSSSWIIADAAKDNFKLHTYKEPGHAGEIVDWDKTKALPEHQADIAKFNKFKSVFYGKPKAIEHEAVVHDFRMVETMYNSPACSGP